MSSEKFEISEDNWKEMLEVEEAFTEGDPSNFFGAGNFVKKVFDKDSQIVIGRMISVEKEGDSFAFEKLVEKFGGYTEYYEREAVLLAKRVWRYLKEKYPDKVESFSQDDKPAKSDWFQVLLEKVEKQKAQIENLELAHPDKWKVRKKLASIFEEKKVDIRKWGESTKKNNVQKTIEFLLGQDEEEPKYGIADIHKALGEDVKLKTFNNNILYCTRTQKTQERPEVTDPNYFYEIAGKYGLTGRLDDKETEHDACAKTADGGVYENDAHNTSGRIRLVDLDKKQVPPRKTANTIPIFVKLEICGELYPSNSEDDSLFTYKRLLEIFFETVSSQHPDKMEKIRDLAEIVLDEDFFYRPTWKIESGENIKIPTDDPVWTEIANSEDIIAKWVYPLGNDMWLGNIATPYIHDCFCELLKHPEIDLADQVFIWMNEKELASIEVDSKMKNEIIEELLKENYQVILTGAPGTGKTHLAREIAKALVKKPRDSVNPDKSNTSPKAAGEPDNNQNEANSTEIKNRIKQVQFHPGYDYSDFIIGLKPLLINDDMTINLKPIPQPKYKNGENNFDESDEVKLDQKVSIAYGWQNGVFKEFAGTAANDRDHNYVFIIDEINRADLSSVFGETFSCLEKDYRGKQDCPENYITLPSGHLFMIPDNLFIIGTMNDIDRSVESMDFALRRRFAWYEVTAKDSQEIIEIRVPDEKIKKALKAAMDKINNIIKGEDNNGDENLENLGLGTEYQLGGAYFIPREPEGSQGYDKDEVRNGLWNNHIQVILSDYLRGNKNKDKAIKAFEYAYTKAFNDCVEKEEQAPTSVNPAAPEQSAGAESAKSNGTGGGNADKS